MGTSGNCSSGRFGVLYDHFPMVSSYLATIFCGDVVAQENRATKTQGLTEKLALNKKIDSKGPTKRINHPMYGSRFWFHPAFTAATGALITYLMLSRNLETKLVKQKGYPNAWSLTIHLRFKDTESRREFMKHWAPLARYVRDAEPFCLLFEAIQSDKDPLLLIVDERYIDKNVYVEKHRSSAAFHAFRPYMQKLQDEGKVEVVGESGTGISLDSI